MRGSLFTTQYQTNLCEENCTQIISFHTEPYLCFFNFRYLWI